LIEANILVNEGHRLFDRDIIYNATASVGLYNSRRPLRNPKSRAVVWGVEGVKEANELVGLKSDEDSWEVLKR